MGGAMLPKPEGEWGMPPEMVTSLTGYGPDTDKNIAEAQAIMQKLGYSDCKTAADQDPDPEPADLSRSRRDPDRPAQEDLHRQRTRHSRHAALVRAAGAKDYTIGLNVTGVSVDDPDGNIVENYSCKSERNYTQYCNAEVDRLLAAQSSELDKEKRRKMVWDIERLLVEDAARPDHPALIGRQLLAASCEELSSRTIIASTTICGSRMCGWISEVAPTRPGNARLRRSKRYEERWDKNHCKSAGRPRLQKQYSNRGHSRR